MPRVGKTGRYICTFANETTTCVLTVRVKAAPVFVTKIADLKVKERQSAFFTAKSLTAKVTWHKEGEPVDQINARS